MKITGSIWLDDMDYGLRVTDLDGKTHDRSLTISTEAPPPGLITPAPDS